MARIALVEDGVVTNVINADADYCPEDGYIAIASDEAAIGDCFDGEKFFPAVATPPAPETLRARAFHFASGILATPRQYAVGGAAVMSDASSATRGDLLFFSLACAESKEFPWLNGDGKVTKLTAAQIGELASCVGDFTISVYEALADVLSAIDRGLIANLAQIDAAPWPK